MIHTHTGADDAHIWASYAYADLTYIKDLRQDWAIRTWKSHLHLVGHHLKFDCPGPRCSMNTSCGHHRACAPSRYVQKHAPRPCYAIYNPRCCRLDSYLMLRINDIVENARAFSLRGSGIAFVWTNQGILNRVGTLNIYLSHDTTPFKGLSIWL